MKSRHFVNALGASLFGASSVSGMAFADGHRSRRRDEDERDDTDVPQISGDADGHVVVVGGGMAGASAAKFLRLWGGPNLRVTLVERESRYVSNIMSNLVLNGSRTISGLTYDYDELERNYGIERIVGEVRSVSAGQVRLASGAVLGCDRVIVAPGIQFDTIPGLESADDQARFPHAWQAGAQNTTLREQIRAMPDGGVFVMTIPKAPYRCPPGPYERACVVADWLKRNRSGCKVLVLDANADITAEPDNFRHAFDVTHAGVIEYVPDTTIVSIDPANRVLQTNWEPVYGDVINPIPSQRCGKLLYDSGLLGVNERWANVDVLSYESREMSHIHVIGDSAGTTQPKAGHIANVEAKVCADAVIRLLTGQEPFQSPVTNSACYSPITNDTATWLTAVYGYDAASRTMKVVPSAAGASNGATRGNFREMNKWFDQLMADSYA